MNHPTPGGVLVQVPDTGGCPVRFFPVAVTAEKWVAWRFVEVESPWAVEG